MNVSKAQRGVAIGMAIGAVVSSLAWILPWCLDRLTAQHYDMAKRLSFCLPWEVLPTACLAAGIAWIAQHRFFHANAIDGQNPPDDIRLAAGRAYLQNTLEQIVLLAMMHATAVPLLPPRLLPTIPVTNALFVVGRVCFAWGYLKGAASRAFGFAVTFYPTLIGLLFAVMLAASKAVTP